MCEHHNHEHSHGTDHEHEHRHHDHHHHENLHHGHPHHATPQGSDAAPLEARRGLRIAVTGKGGVGKTTFASLLARAFADDGARVLAVDADPDANLAQALGISPEAARALQPVARMKELAEERTGASGGYGSFFKLNPKVSDLPERFCLTHDGVRFLWMGTFEQGGSGCACPESTLVKRLMGHLLLERDEVVIMDMEAGLEHLGRRTAESVDALVVVVEPGQRSIQTAEQIMKLAADLGIEEVYVVGSKVRDEEDRLLISGAIPARQLLGTVSFCDGIRRADRENQAPARLSAGALEEVGAIKERLLALHAA
ncbi:ATP-binding protein [Citrifermentans bremense]|nr:carbon monoxide dehydrogenase accessory protein CooC [Citrifermentans bremense]